MSVTTTVQSSPIITDTLIKEQVSLADKNWFETGGAARYFAQPQSAQELAQAIRFANDHNLDWYMLGSGANVLISDEGFDGLVINPKITSVSHEHTGNKLLELKVGAGMSLDALISYCLRNNVLGLEEFSGIPGTVGGAVFINLHYFNFLLSQFLVRATVIEKKTGALMQVDNAWFNFGYNSSRLHERNHILVDATFALTRGTDEAAAYAKGRHDEIVRHRSHRYPTKGTCGSFFRNFYEDEVSLVSEGKKVIWVAYYLDKIGVKGALSVGDAQVSHQHANMIVNRGSATTADIIAVARQMQKQVLDAFGVIPQPECQLVGFKEYPLMKDADV